MANIYLAGGLFNVAERVHSLLLERPLISLGHTLVLPQRQALLFFREEECSGPISGEKYLDLPAVVNDCEKHCTDPAFITVACGDGADADSGTSYEIAAAKFATGRAVVYRTDTRTSENIELGINAMLRAQYIRYIYFPCFVTEMSNVERYYKELARRIHVEVTAIETTE